MRLNADLLPPHPPSSDSFDKDNILLRLLGTAVLVFGIADSWASQVEKAEARLQVEGFLDAGRRAAAVSSWSVVQAPLCTFSSIACREEGG